MLGREACSEAGIEKSHVVRQASIEDKQQGGKGRGNRLAFSQESYRAGRIERQGIRR